MGKKGEPKKMEVGQTKNEIFKKKGGIQLFKLNSGIEKDKDGDFETN